MAGYKKGGGGGDDGSGSQGGGGDYEARLARTKSHTFILSPLRRAGRGGVKKSLFWRLFAPSPLFRQSVALRFLHFPRLLLLACSGCRPHLKSRGWEGGVEEEE